MDIPLHVVVLAAGKGTRMRSDKPKVLHHLAGKPLIEHIVKTAENLGASGTTIIYGHGAKLIQSWADESEIKNIHWVEQKEQLGTAHAVLQAIPALEDMNLSDDTRILLMAGDVPLIQAKTLNRLLDACSQSTNSFGLVTLNLANPFGYGRIIRNASNQVVGVVEEKDATAEQRAIQEINTNIMLPTFGQIKQLLPKIGNNNAQQEYYLPDLISLIAGTQTQNDANTILVVQPDYPWEVEGANNRAQLHDLERQYQLFLAYEMMAQGLALQDAHRFDISGKLTFGQDVQIGANVQIIGLVEIGNNVTIGSNVVLKNVQIGHNSHIHEFSHIEGATIGESCHLGPFARVREGSEFLDDSKIGNFVETKKSRIGVGAKVSHLSYIGDALVGDEANIGAGTIVCNYDGANKHKTSIGAHAFVGSNSSLVAPITIGEGATIGAGSTLTKDAPHQKLTLARAQQVTIDAWQRPKK